MLESIALGMLLENDLTGYDIKKFIENRESVSSIRQVSEACTPH